ncbi:type II toxin-antitoxin system YafQ family toxin [Tuanshanicoccus lijuaniae]|nr:type II toxin-antitoxin system YafQ family toxin [Aerococcaceae bacterium zg-1292]MBS4456847.1 type II toxin-antitoxin system YafQ family toxin [Aerococcaceae bacterium zg-A91]MBS4458675.1 type II toxin-antitoxin system YafQ family toxin [Aerococcaceae bacterium zg-BR33]QQA38194.1 type II toxin-antitoxin system YafQ family toxin [Aerococcaceae bacterium zg-1292]
MIIETTAKFRRDYKRLYRKHYDMDKLDTVIELIQQQEMEILAKKYQTHTLKGEFQGIQECHIEKDWLLMYEIIQNELVLLLMRTGSHDDLF